VKLDTKLSLRRRAFFLGMVALVLYGIVSGGIAWATLDTCGDADAPKTWNFVPPGWECTSRPYGY
jgi:hypothetical protein